jgi:hypothetical protein
VDVPVILHNLNCCHSPFIFSSNNNTPLTTNSNADCPTIKDQDLAPFAPWELLLSIGGFFEWLSPYHVLSQQ